jgi:DNA-binding response OmpR family regulator
MGYNAPKVPRILVVDDEKQILEVVKAYLEKSGFTVMTAENGRDALLGFEHFPPDAVLLDLMLPDISGEAVCKKIRAKSKVPIIMLTAKVDEEHLVAGLSMGADDYVKKPFSPKELTARVKAALRRSGFTAADERITAGGLALNLEKRSVEKDSNAVLLTANEYNILELFMTNPGKIFSREEIIENAKSANFDGFDRAVDTHIKNLRKKIEDDPKNPRFIETVYGMGYRFSGSRND